MSHLQVYKYYGNDTISIIPFGPTTGGPALYSANLDVAWQVIGRGHKSSFIKPEISNQALLFVLFCRTSLFMPFLLIKNIGYRIWI